MDRGAWWVTVHGVAKSWTQQGTHAPAGKDTVSRHNGWHTDVLSRHCAVYFTDKEKQIRRGFNVPQIAELSDRTDF